MKKTISKKIQRQLYITNDELENAKLITLLKAFHNKSQTASFELVKSKGKVNTFHYGMLDAQIIWLFLRNNEIYNDLVLPENQEYNPINTSSLYSMKLNYYDPANLFLPKHEKEIFTFLLYEQVESVLQMTLLRKTLESVFAIDVSKLINKPMLFYVNPFLSVKNKEEIFKAQSRKALNAKVTDGSINFMDTDKVIKILISVYFSQFTVTDHGYRKHNRVRFSEIYEQVTGKDIYAKVTDKDIDSWQKRYIDIADASPYCFLNKSVKKQRLFE